MAFDQNSVPKDLRPLNLPRTVADEPRIVAAVASSSAASPSAVNGAASTTGRSPEFFTNLEGSIPLIYPATVPESGFVGLGYGNPTTGISTWVPRVPVPVAVAVPPGGVNVPSVGYGYGTNFGNRVTGNAVDHAGNGDMVAGYGYTPNLGNRVNANGSNELSNSGFSNSPSLGNRGSGSAADQGSEDGADDSVSGKKVKLLCSFGGKILPRPSDGILRYVGGQTRIISVRKDVSFTDLLRKMMDVYGQPVVIKYQLPDEDLDSLVSISCSDDLDNMMDEYEKLAERSSDGSAKLRVFLFSPSQLDNSGVVQFGDLQDSGQSYVEAVNRIADVVGPIGGGITRRESITSATSTQNSDFSGSDAVDNLGPGQGDTVGPPSTSMLSLRGYSATSSDSNARIVSADPNPPMYAEASAMLSGIPVGKSGPPQSLYSQPQVEYDRSVPATVPQQQMGNAFQLGSPAHPPHLQAYVDPRQEILNHADYRHLPPQSGFPNTHLLGTTGSVFAPQHFRDGNSVATPHQYIPAVNMTMTQSSSHDTIRPTVVQPLMQHQPSQFEHYRDKNAFGTKIVQLPVEPRYNAYQQQLLPTNVGGYGWHQVHQPERVVFSDGLVPHQQVTFSDRIPRSDDYLCHKALPHAHSDPLVQDQREFGASPLCDPNTVHHSLLLEDTMKAQPVNRVMVAGAFREGSAEQVGSAPVVLGHVDPQFRIPQSDTVVSHKLEALHHSLLLEDTIKAQPVNRVMVARAFREGSAEQVVSAPVVLGHVDPQFRIPQSDTVVSHNLEALHDTRKLDNSNQPKITVPQGMMRLPGDAPSPYIMLTGGIPPSHQDDSVHQPSVPTQYQVEQETILRKPMNSDVLLIAGVPIQAPEHLVHEAPNESLGKLSPPVAREHILDPTISHDQLRPVGERMEGLQIRNFETNFNNEQNKSPVDRFRKEVLDHVSEPMAGGEVLVDKTFIRPQVVLDSNHNKLTEVLPASIEVSYAHSSRPLVPHGVVQPSVYSNPMSYPQSMMGNHLLNSPQVGPGIPALSVGEPTYVTDRTLPVAEWKNDVSRLEPNNCLGDGEASSSTVISSSFSPCSSVGDVQDSSNSLFSNQDPWSIRNDGQFPPPRPCKISTRKEASDTRDPLSENHFNNAVDLIKEDGATLVLNNPNKDFNAENSRSCRGSAEELIRQELQAVAEGVAASVLTSNPDSTVNEGSELSYEGNRDSEVTDKDIGMQHKAKFEDMKNKSPEKGNLRFPVSEGIGCLQIIKNSDLEELRELGSGTVGTVYHGKWRGTDVAIKRINGRCFAGKPSEQDRMIDDFWNEAIKLADLHHPNVVAFYGVVLDGPGGSVATVTEYMVNGSLRNALQKKERNLDKRKRLLIAMDVAFGMEYLHGKNIVHFDLKSDNLLVNLRDPHRPICKVGDLGLSKVKCQTLISGGVRGTLPWMAPELLNGSSSLVSEKVDVFSFGIVLWELLTGEEPYADLHYGAIIGGIVSNTLRPPVPESCEPEWRLLMERCWSAEPSDRPNFTVIANELRAMTSKIPPRGQNPVQQ